MLKNRFRLTLDALDARDVPATLLVDDSFTSTSASKFTSIQAAVNRAAVTSGSDTILVSPGTYTEQVEVVGSKLNDLTIRSTEKGAASIIAPPGKTDTAEATFAIVRVSGAARVDLDGFVIRGPSAGLDAGVLVDRGGSATVENNLITAIRGAALTGDQNGVGVFVGGVFVEDGGGTARVANNRVTDYQKGGIVVLDAASSAEVTKNVVIGAGATPLVAQNGIQVSNSATATITRNTVTDNVYADNGSPTFDATGVALLNAGRVDIKDNVLTHNDVGVLGQEQTAKLTVSGNRITSSVVDGVQLLAVNGAELTGNQINASGRDGIRLDGVNGVGGTSNTQIVRNGVTNSGEDGLHVSGLSSRNTVSRNQFVGSVRFDLFDASVGTKSYGTRNTYSSNDFDTTNLDV